MEEQNNNKKGEKNNSYNNFNINSKSLILKLNFHRNWVRCLALLKDGRLAAGSDDYQIIIYDKITYKPDLKLEAENIILYLTTLSSGILACAITRHIKLLYIKGNTYEILQTFEYHDDWVYKIIELNNNNLVSCSEDKKVIFYRKTTELGQVNTNKIPINLRISEANTDLYNKYEKDYEILSDFIHYSMTQTKENEICYSENTRDSYISTICFYDIYKRKNNSTISNVKTGGPLSPFNLATKDLLIIGSENIISIIDVNKYKIIRLVEVDHSLNIFSFCMLNENMFLIGNNYGEITQWKIEGDNIILISKKENAHEKNIYFLIKVGDGHIASCSYDHLIKIW